MTVGVVLMAYGTPATPDDIAPYYTDIRRGRPPTPEQLADLTRRYNEIGGVSPLMQRTQAQRDAVQAALDRLSPGTYDVVLGLKHAAPMIETAVHSLAALGHDRIVGAVLAPHYSAMSVGQYLGRLDAAAAEHGIAAAGVESWATEPALIDFLATELGRLLADPTPTRVVFTAHSLPARVLDSGDPYPDQLRATAGAVADQLGLIAGRDWEIAWQSAGRTPEPWLGPDILETIDRLADANVGVSRVVVCACGFVADHLELLYDLDIEACKRAQLRGLTFARTACVNDDPAVMAALARLIHERA
jgi:ferrochelatase